MAAQKLNVKRKHRGRTDYKTIKMNKKKSKVNEYLVIEQRIKDEAPPTALELLDNPSLEFTPKTYFKDLPLSDRTREGLEACKFSTLRNVQQLAIPHALAGRNLVINARTGSGKTLAYAVPVLENLWRQGFLPDQGLGAIVLVPTKELAIQVYEVFRKLGPSHDLSLGVIFGGKDREDEATRLHGINILIATPGRLLEHLERTPNFDVDGIRMLVIDEADRMMELGFTETLQNILSSLTPERQTILSSATPIVFENISINTVFNNAPEYVDLYVGKAAMTPDTLKQYYANIPVELKISYLYSFLSQHKFSRTIVFASTCRQVRFLEHILNKSNLGVPVTSLSGKMSSQGRLARHTAFETWKFGVIICTDVAARGLDFTRINWVFQLDAPENVNEYVHRVGRTARSSKGGNAILLLSPFEEDFVRRIQNARIPITQVTVRSGKLTSLDQFVAKEVNKDELIREWARKAVAHYLKSVYMTNNQDSQVIAQINLEAFAASYGLEEVPQIEASESINKIRRLESLKEKIKGAEGETTTSFKVERNEVPTGNEIRLKTIVSDYKIDDNSDSAEVSATPSPLIVSEIVSENSEMERLNTKLQRFAQEFEDNESSLSTSAE